MKGWTVTEIGTGPQLCTDLPEPQPGPGEVQLRIEGCGLNFADLLMIEGRYQDTPAPPFVPGMEVCGRVTAQGEGVSAPALGARVAVFGGAGGLAEMGCFPAERCVAVPEKMPSDVAAGFLVAYSTSHVALAHRARLRAGERLVVLGAAGGVGLTAVELGARMGAEVVAVARGAAKLEVARAAGAAHLIDAEVPDLRDRLRALGGADVVYDAVGGTAFEAAFRATNPGGRILVIGFASGDVPQIKANHLLVKNIDAMGVYWGGYLRFAPEVVTDSIAALMAMYERGDIAPHISHVLPLERAPDGLELLRTRRSTGKVVVTP
ncbi:NADPH:quinone oxidoreductase family protein [Jannaschia seohaensis]|uniref:NADPH:quinone reductase n=1 Tax=Jannaschia seohaensis TaxID=475081 RepID=A0A2Y9C898_9RHOB|nr:NADPH:quinone oxidoreductase family protein [Jannaschia seohaensis]PWJ17006.1 NADPH:quinone reductase-like Zn-dependent oxidoreductase [Jannaschia seohaensis]SSA48343.1 NADPH:quinone reductase [Jannaschia seohaensis]